MPQILHSTTRVKIKNNYNSKRKRKLNSVALKFDFKKLKLLF